MGVVVETTDNAVSSCERWARSRESHFGAAWILPDEDRALARRKTLASDASPAQMGCTVASLKGWVDDRWELFGDGRIVVDDVQRRLIMKRELEATGLFSATPGTVNALCQAVEQGFGVEAFVSAMAGSELGNRRLSDTEQRVLGAARGYAMRLSELGLCERSEAMRLLASDASVFWPMVICEGFPVLECGDAAFFAALSCRTDVVFVAETAAESRFDVGEFVASALIAAGAQVERRDVRETRRLVDEADEMAESGELDEADEMAESGELDESDELDELAESGELGEADELGEVDELASLAAALYYPDAEHPVRASGAVRALLPAGRYAVASMLSAAVGEAEGSVLVACNDPAAVFDDLVRRAPSCEKRIEVRYTRPFCQTDFGAALLNCFDLLDEGAPDTFQATDLALSSLTGMSLFSVSAYDAKWRADRLTSREGVLDDVCDRAPETAAPFVGLLECGRVDEALDVAEERYRVLGGVSEAFRSEQLAAVACARRLFAQAFAMGSTVQDACALLADAAVSVRVATRRGSSVALVLSHAQAACVDPNSFDQVIVGNLNSSEQPLRENRTSIDQLFEKLGIGASQSALFEARLRMLRLVRAARRQLTLVRALHNEETDPTYPAVVFEDVVDCYRSRPSDASELDKTTALPSVLLDHSAQRGEELLSANLTKGVLPGRCDIPMGKGDEVVPAARALVARGVLLSPSAIEEYLSCPQKWFALRRLRLKELDAGFSPREKGSFIHGVLRRFYEELPAVCGVAKPTIETLPQAERLLEEVFDSQRRNQPQLPPYENPLIPVSETERRHMDAMLLHLKGFLARDVQLLPGFTPRHFEFAFGRDVPFEYAGVPLMGFIDRVDVDDEGRAVVVDYKSSLSEKYFLLPANAIGFELPAKVQTLIYAQVVRRLLGLDVVGALYVHTQNPGASQPKACGAYSDFVFAPSDVLNAPVKRNALSAAGFSSFHDLLDEVEDLIARRLDGLLAGDVSIDPHSKDACDFCPVLSCDGRL